MTSPTKAIVWQIEAKPFGDGATITGPALLNLRFPGQYYDSETGLHQNWFRDYMPKTGRYIEADPFGLDVLMSRARHLRPRLLEDKTAGAVSLKSRIELTLLERTISVAMRMPSVLMPYQYAMNKPPMTTDPSGQIPIEIVLKLISCPSAYFKCKKLEDALRCADEHRDPVKCLERGEPNAGNSLHGLTECFGKGGEECATALLECGVL
jgi:RHS repeat-associated protein